MQVSRVERVGLSIASAIFAQLPIAVCLAVRDRSFTDFFGAYVAFSFLVIPGWLLALPMVLLFSRIDGRRLWLLGTYGVLLGPGIIFGSAALDRSGGSIRSLALFFVIALVISSLSTGLYLASLRCLSRDSIETAK